MSLGTFLLAAVLGEFVLTPLSILAHELGHAMVALRSSQDKVTVVVGRRSAAIGVVSERLAIWWSPIPSRGIVFEAHCIGTWARQVLGSGSGQCSRGRRSKSS